MALTYQDSITKLLYYLYKNNKGPPSMTGTLRYSLLPSLLLSLPLACLVVKAYGSINQQQLAL